MSTAAETTVELAVELSCQKCVDKTNTVLSKAEKVSDFKVDLKTQSVLVTSSLPSTQLIDLIENKGDLLRGIGISDQNCNKTGNSNCFQIFSSQ